MHVWNQDLGSPTGQEWHRHSRWWLCLGIVIKGCAHVYGYDDKECRILKVGDWHCFTDKYWHRVDFFVKETKTLFMHLGNAVYDATSADIDEYNKRNNIEKFNDTRFLER